MKKKTARKPRSRAANEIDGFEWNMTAEDNPQAVEGYFDRGCKRRETGSYDSATADYAEFPSCTRFAPLDMRLPFSRLESGPAALPGGIFIMHPCSTGKGGF